MLMYIHIKRFLIWSFITIVFGIIISLAFLFSRDLTMNTVKINEFKIYYSFLNQMDNIDLNKTKENFNLMLSAKKYPLLPIALISDKYCMENVLPYYDQRFNLSICKTVNSKILTNLNDLDIFEDTYGSTIIELENKHFIYKKIDKDNVWLIASINNYYKSNGFSRFISFLMSGNEGLSWFTSLSSLKTFFIKSKFLWSVILPFSYILYFLFTFYYLRQTHSLKKLKLEKEKAISEWSGLNRKIQDLRTEQLILEEELKEKSQINTQNQLLNNEIDDLRKMNSNLISDIKVHLEQMRELELKENSLSQKMKNTSIKLTTDEKEEVLEKSLQRLGQLDLLWQYEPSWKERFEIENYVSLRDEFTPFTISQAFMCFERLIQQLVAKVDKEFKTLQLVDQINIIFDKNVLPIHYKEEMHSIRRARNQWVHQGKQPSKEIYNLLLDTLDKTEMKPLL